MNLSNLTKSKNPMLSDKAIGKASTVDRKANSGPVIRSSNTMTVSGAVNKTLVLVLILLCVTLFSYQAPSQVFMTVGALGGAGVYFLTSFKPTLAPYTAPVYAALKGLLVGSVSAVYAAQYGGIVFQAVSLTIATLLMMLIIHKSGLIPVTKKFRMAVSMAVGAIMIVYLISWVGQFVGFTVPFIHDSGPIGIGITVVIIGVAALNLLLDFDSFEKGEETQAPKYMEWYFSMGLLFTLVWLYIEFLRLLGKLQRD